MAVILDLSRYYNRILSIDPVAQTARVQPGVVLDRLREAAAVHGLTFGPDPATHRQCTLGGMMGNNSCGVHALMAGKTVDNVISLEVLTYDGTQMEVGQTSAEDFDRILRGGGRPAEIYRGARALIEQEAERVRQKYPKIPRRVSGYNLDCLLPENGFDMAKALIGSEGTLVVILEATLRLVKNPAHRSLVLLGYPDVYQAGEDVPAILPFKPIGLEGIDERLLQKWKAKGVLRPGLLPAGEGWLYVEFGADSPAGAEAQAMALIEAVGRRPKGPVAKYCKDPQDVKDAWLIRESALALTAFTPGERDTWEGWDDSAVDPARLGPYLREFRQLYDKYGFGGAFYGHFGQGCVHTRITFDLYTANGLKQMRAFLDEAADLVVRYGGSLSGEHGDGQGRAELLPKMFGPEIVTAFEAFKDLWDPLNRMNPGKIVRAYKILDNLRLGPDYHPDRPATQFTYTHDQNDFSRAALRCVGVGKCRADGEGTMCPSYRVTREEKHSTRGRARLLFEMLRGEVLPDDWKNVSVKEALDLCLACKGCKTDCPVNVDMATYKAEFLSHYYRGKVRPRTAYVFGYIFRWARLASIAPRLVNAVTQSRFLSPLIKWMGGVAQKRQLPAFASETFRDWFLKRPVRSTPKGSVILWPDTFTNYFHPEIGRAAVEVLEHLGFTVRLPSAGLCCGRPLYDFGFLDQAKRQLAEILDVLKVDIEAGAALVGLEPSCLAVFRDELTHLFPGNPTAEALRQRAFTLSEFLIAHTSSDSLPPFTAPAVVQPHCHHRAVMGFGPEAELFKRLGLDAAVLDKGCCGMAGAFGFEAEHYTISQQCGELGVLPAVRQAPKDALVVANGFSCREQISQGTSARPLHLAELLKMAIDSKRITP